MIGSRAGWKLAAVIVPLALLAAAPAAARRPQPRWSRIGPEAAWMNALAVTYGPGRVLVATADAGLFRSDDGGSSWVAASDGIPVARILDVAADPADARTAYAGTAAGLFKSHDGGATWSATGLREEVDRVAVAPSAHWRLYAVTLGGTSPRKVWRSDDGGAAWRRIDAGLSDGLNSQGLAVDPVDADRAYLVLDNDHLFATRDGGGHWIDEGAELPSDDVRAFAGDPRRPGTLYASLSGAVLDGLFKSQDGGATWTLLPIPRPPGSTVVDVLAVSPASGTVYAGLGVPSPLATRHYFLFRSDDGGATWAEEPMFEPLRQLAADPRRPGLAYAGSVTRTLRRGADGRWALTKAGLRAAAVWAVRADPHTPGTLYASALIGADLIGEIHLGVLRSRDYGATWELATGGLPRLPAKLITSPTLPAGNLFALEVGGLDETTDGGGHWSPLGAASDFMTDVAVAPNRPQSFLASAYRPGSCGFLPCPIPPEPRALESDDGGATWSGITGRLSPSPAIGVFNAVRIDPAHPWLAYLGGTESYRSRNGGASWTRMPIAAEIFDLALDPAFPRTLYASESTGGKVLKSVDAGATWTVASAGLPTATTFATGELATDPATSTVYLATDAGVFASRDRAASWQPLADLPSPAVQSLDADPFRPGVVYAGTAGGLFAFTP
jgi:photosystem II stability/assembly factor-like uncharacterized protein